jgi:cation:H+ antiporter
MPLATALPLFILSLALTLYAARAFARNLDALAERRGVSESLIGLISALAADAPEIVSALVALIGGQAGASLGVLVGASALNLASMIGLSALLSGAICARQSAVIAQALPALAASALGALLLTGLLSAWLAGLLGAGVLGAYVLVARGGASVGASAEARGRAAAQRAGAGARQSRGGRGDRHAPAKEALLIAAALVAIIAGSTGLVHSALAIGASLHLERAAVGLFLLAPLASLPNALTGLRFGLAGRGEALVAEAFQSNAINLALGAITPALIVSVGPLGVRIEVALWYLLGATALLALALVRGSGLRRPGGLALIAIYAGFVALTI